MKEARSPGTTDVLGLLGLAQRAGQLTVGVEITRKALSAGEVRLVLLAEDASPRQIERVRVLAGHRGVPVAGLRSQDMLGRALGKGPVSAVGVTGRSFARRLLDLLPSTRSGSSDGKKT